jgi:hypothetical protein
MDEHLKLWGAWMNSLAAALVTVGFLTPIFAFSYGLATPAADKAWLLTWLPIECILGAFFMHGFGQFALTFIGDE